MMYLSRYKRDYRSSYPSESIRPRKREGDESTNLLDVMKFVFYYEMICCDVIYLDMKRFTNSTEICWYSIINTVLHDSTSSLQVLTIWLLYKTTIWKDDLLDMWRYCSDKSSSSIENETWIVREIEITILSYHRSWIDIYRSVIRTSAEEIC